jgi:hypothetical protein
MGAARTMGRATGARGGLEGWKRGRVDVGCGERWLRASAGALGQDTVRAMGLPRAMDAMASGGMARVQRGRWASGIDDAGGGARVLEASDHK